MKFEWRETPTERILHAHNGSDIVGFVHLTEFFFNVSPDSRLYRKLAVVTKSYVQIISRRRGIRTAMQKEILKHYNAVMSAAATPEGEAWMKAFGYEYCPALGVWTFENKDIPVYGGKIKELAK